tara:strand:- start:66 stop:677 length:612 start_codon:yes stop_codon:yes gene_type:complete
MVGIILKAKSASMVFLQTPQWSLKVKIKLALLLVVAPLMFGCASVTGSKEQQTAITATCEGVQVSGATCTVKNDKGSWTTKTPGSVNLTKSYEDISVTCTAGDSQGAAVMSSKSNGAVWSNILLGGGIGYLVDRNTGAGFNYPTSVTVPLGDGCTNFKRVTGSTAVEKNSVEERLKSLQGLLDKGLITSDEYTLRREKVLEGL